MIDSINEILVRRLVAEQFPQWQDLVVRSVSKQGWDNRTFHLGDDMLVRLPSNAEYELQVEKEQHWLPTLAPLLPLPIPVPLAMGKPGASFPWKWSIYRFLPGESANSEAIQDLDEFAASLANFLMALQRIDSTGGPTPGVHSFYRGGLLSTYDEETRQALTILKDKIDVETVRKVWETALASTWNNTPVWVHGDISIGNLIIQEGHLSAVIDFGQLAIGDPACDLAIAWTFFKGTSREIFRKKLSLDADTWARGRGWALWKYLIVAAGLTNWNALEASEPLKIINEILDDYRLNAKKA